MKKFLGMDAAQNAAEYLFPTAAHQAQHLWCDPSQRQALTDADTWACFESFYGGSGEAGPQGAGAL